MTDIDEKNQTRGRKTVKVFLLLAAILLSPLACCGGTYVLDALPSSFLPPSADFMVALFEAEVQLSNRTAETLYITPITTTTGEPVIIGQLGSIRQKDYPLKPGQSRVISYDLADAPLAGIAVCRSSADCRFLGADQLSEACDLEGYGALPELEDEWLAVIQASPERSLAVIVYPALGLVPVACFAGWLVLTIKERAAGRTATVKNG